MSEIDYKRATAKILINHKFRSEASFWLVQAANQRPVIPLAFTCQSCNEKTIPGSWDRKPMPEEVELHVSFVCWNFVITPLFVSFGWATPSSLQDHARGSDNETCFSACSKGAAIVFFCKTVFSLTATMRTCSLRTLWLQPTRVTLKRSSSLDLTGITWKEAWDQKCTRWLQFVNFDSACHKTCDCTL